MHGVEREDEVERFGFGVAVERGQVAHVEGHVVEPELGCPGARPLDRIVAEVEAEERAVREPLREREDRLAPSTPEIGHSDPVLESLEKSGDEREDVVEEPGECRLVALLGHRLVEPAEALVGHTAALAEAAHDVVLDLAEHRDPLRGHGDVVRRRGAGQPHGVLGREACTSRCRGRPRTMRAAVIAPSHSRT